MHVVWDWNAFFGYLHSTYLLQGAWTTIWLTAASLALGLVLGLLVALMKLSSHGTLRRVAEFYIWLIRGTPLLIQLIIIYTGLPQFGIRLDVIPSVLLGLGLNEGAYLSEIIRAGILSVPKGQFEAARAVGMPPITVMRVVILPQAIRIIVPPLGNDVNGLLKTTTLASVISMEELLRRTQLLILTDFHVLEAFVAAAIMYLVMTTVWGLIQEQIEKYFGRSVAATAVGRGDRPPPGSVAVISAPVAVIDKQTLERDAR